MEEASKNDLLIRFVYHQSLLTLLLCERKDLFHHGTFIQVIIIMCGLLN